MTGNKTTYCTNPVDTPDGKTKIKEQDKELEQSSLKLLSYYQNIVTASWGHSVFSGLFKRWLHQLEIYFQSPINSSLMLELLSYAQS